MFQGREYEDPNGGTRGDRAIPIQQLGDNAGKPPDQLLPGRAELETYVLCARVKFPNTPGGSGLNWVISPGGDELAPGVLRGVLESLEAENGNGKGP